MSKLFIVFVSVSFYFAHGMESHYFELTNQNLILPLAAFEVEAPVVQIFENSSFNKDVSQLKNFLETYADPIKIVSPVLWKLIVEYKPSISYIAPREVLKSSSDNPSEILRWARMSSEMRTTAKYVCCLAKRKCLSLQDIETRAEHVKGYDICNREMFAEAQVNAQSNFYNAIQNQELISRNLPD